MTCRAIPAQAGVRRDRVAGNDPVHVVLDRLGVERRAVVEGDALSQLEDVALIADLLGQRFGEPRAVLQVRGHVDQRIADQPEIGLGIDRAVGSMSE